MKKNKFVTSALVATLLMSGSAATAATVLAANGASGGTEGKTTNTINFNENAPVKPPLPVDPTTDSVNPAGPLALIYVTNELDFGTHRAGEQTDFAGETGDKAFKMDTDGKTAVEDSSKPAQNFFMQVSDSRPDNNSGWVVSGALDSPQGISITFPQADKIDSSLFKVGDQNLGNVTTTNTVFKGDKTEAEFFKTADKVSGYGSWLRENDATKIMMTVPANKQSGQISNTITWTLKAGPDATVADPNAPVTPPAPQP